MCRVHSDALHDVAHAQDSVQSQGRSKLDKRKEDEERAKDEIEQTIM